MSDSPSYAPVPLATARGPLSGSALSSFIVGVLMCVPLTGLVAIILSIVGFKATRDNARRGRGFAITGLVLGLVSSFAWCAFAVFLAYLVSASAIPRATLHTFARNAFAGNVPAAIADCDPIVTAAELDALHSYVISFGTYSDLTCTAVKLSANSLGETCQLSGFAHFSSGSRTFNTTLVKSSGAWKVYGFHVY